MILSHRPTFQISEEILIGSHSLSSCRSFGPSSASNRQGNKCESQVDRACVRGINDQCAVDRICPSFTNEARGARVHDVWLLSCSHTRRQDLTICGSKVPRIILRQRCRIIRRSTCRSWAVPLTRHDSIANRKHECTTCVDWTDGNTSERHRLIERRLHCRRVMDIGLIKRHQIHV